MRKPEKPLLLGAKARMWLGVPFQLLATIFAGYALGAYLDGRQELEKPWWTIGLTLLAVLLALYQLVRQVLDMGKTDEKED